MWKLAFRGLDHFASQPFNYDKLDDYIIITPYNYNKLCIIVIIMGIEDQQ